MKKIYLALCGSILLAGAVLGVADAQVASNVSSNGLDTYSCKRAVIYDASTNGATQLVGANGPTVICGFTLWSGGTVNVDLVYGTGTNCATGTTKITPAFSLTAQTGITDSSVFFRGLYVPPNNALCINTSAGTAVQAIVYYNQ